MNDLDAAAPISPLSQRLIDDMTMRFSRETQRNYIRDVGRFATFMGRSPDTATAEDLRRFRVEQREAGVPAPTMNGTVSALRFFFTHTLDRPDLSRRLVRVTHPGTGPGGRHGLCDRQAGNVLSPTYAHGTVSKRQSWPKTRHGDPRRVGFVKLSTRPSSALLQL